MLRTLLLAFLLLPAPIAGQDISTVGPVWNFRTSTESHITNSPTNNGDTPITSAWFSDGTVMGMRNDGALGGSGDKALLITQVTAVAPLTVSLVNNMSSFGASGSLGCVDSGMISRALGMVVRGGNLYVLAFCQNNPNQFRAFVVMSPDKGVHWCNRADMLGNAGVCNSSVWHTDGAMCATDVVSSHTCVQWPISNFDATSKMTNMQYVQTAKDGASQPTIPGVDTSYDYFINCVNGRSANDHCFCHRVLRTDDLMDESKWFTWNGGSSWVAASVTAGQALTFTNGDDASFIGMGAIWSVDFQQFIGTGTFNQPMKAARANFPWGPWTSFTPQVACTPSGVPMSCGNPAGFIGRGFGNLSLPYYSTVVAGARARVGWFDSGETGDGGIGYTTQYIQVDFNVPNGKVGPSGN